MSGQIARLCEHGGYEYHTIVGEERPSDVTRSIHGYCPGGVLLPFDTRTVGKEALADAAWQFNEAVSLLRECRNDGVGFMLVREIDEALPAIQPALEALAVAVLDALNTETADLP